MSYQALLHVNNETTILHTGSFADCLEALDQIGQTKGAPNPATVELKWQAEAVKLEAVTRQTGKDWWGEGEL